MTIWYLLSFIPGLMMTGIVLFVQVVHYPLFTKVSKSVFPQYHQAHQFKVSLLVVPLMLLELGATIFLYLDYPQEMLLVLIALVCVWVSTFFLQVPIHKKLAKDYQDSLVKKLVITNAFRSFFWFAKSMLMIDPLLSWAI